MINVNDYKGKAGRYVERDMSDYDYEVSATMNSVRRKVNFINDYKLDIGCQGEDCKWDGELKPYQLELDHIDPTTKNPVLKGRNQRRRLACLSWKDLLNEVQKCQVLCSNCHRERTHMEGHHGN